MRVFIADGAERTSLAIARSLGEKGIEVHCGECYKFSTTSFSKYCSKSYIYPDPQINCGEFIIWLKNHVMENNYDAIYSSREVTTIPIVYHKHAIEQYVKVPFPDYKQCILTHDKLKTVSLAKQCGIPIPKTYFVDTIDELQAISDKIEYPVVAKARFKTSWKNGQPSMLKVTSKNYIDNFNDLLEVSSEILKISGNMPLIQEYIPGEGYGVEVLFHQGEPRAFFMHKRLHEYPITGGASTLREGVFIADMKDIAFALMKEMKWNGVAMVEFKKDARDGIPKLIEVNGRFWGSLPLSLESGVDFPWLLHTMVINGDVDAVSHYNTGVKCRWLLPGDILWLFASLKSRPDRSKIMKDFFKFRGIKDDIISLNDPLPTLGALRTMMRQIGDVIRGRRELSGEVSQK